MGIHAKALWTLQVSMTALSGDATLPLVSRWFGTSRGLGEGRLSTSVGYPLRQPWSKKHTTKRVRCVSVTVPAWGPGAGPGPVLAADAVRPLPVARAVHGEIVSTPRRRAHIEYPDSQNLLGLPGSELLQPPGKRWIDYLPCMLDEVLAGHGDLDPPDLSVSGCRLCHPLPSFVQRLPLPPCPVFCWLGPRGVAAEKGGGCWLRGGRFGAWASIQPIPEQFQIESPAEVWWQMQPLHPSSGFQTAAGGVWKRQRPLKACHFRKMGAAACSPVHGLTTIDRRPTRPGPAWIGDRTAPTGDSNLVEAVSLAFRSWGSRTTKSINNHTHRAAGRPGTEHKHPPVGVINPLSLGGGGVHGIGRLYQCFIAALL